MPLVVKNSPANARDIRDRASVPGSGRFPGLGHENPPQYSCLENPLDRGAWRAIIHGVTKSQTRLCTLHNRKETVIFNVNTCEKMFLLSHPNYFIVGRYFMPAVLFA